MVDGQARKPAELDSDHLSREADGRVVGGREVREFRGGWQKNGGASHATRRSGDQGQRRRRTARAGLTNQMLFVRDRQGLRVSAAGSWADLARSRRAASRGGKDA